MRRFAWTCALFVFAAAPAAATEPPSIEIRQLEGAPPLKVRFESDAPGWISVDRGPWQALPVEHAADGGTRDLTVVLGGDASGRFRLPFLTQRVRFVRRAPPGPLLTVEGRATSDVLVTVDDVPLADRHVPAGADWPVRLPSGARRVRVACSAPDHASWVQTVHLDRPRDVRVTCDPVPARSLVFLRSDAPGTRFYVGTTPVPDVRTCPVGVDCPVGVPTFGPGTPPLATGWAERGRWYVTRALGADPMRLCAAAPDRAPVCAWIDPGAASGPVVVDLALPPSSPPPPSPPPPRPVADDQPDPPAARWVPGPVELVGVVGAAWKHRRTFATTGGGVRVTPAWGGPCLRPGTDRCLAFEGALVAEQAEEPVFLRRREAETRLARGHLAVRWAPWTWTAGAVRVDPTVALGAFASPDIAVGPWAGAGVRFALGFVRVSPGLGVPVFVKDRLGHFGLEAHLDVAVAVPGEDE